MSKKANINGPKTILGAPILFFMYFVISFTNEKCTLAKSSKRNSTVLSDSKISFFSVTSKYVNQQESLKLITSYT